MTRAEIEFQDLFQAICHPVMILDDNYTILKANHSTIDSTSLKDSDIVGRKCYQVFHGAEEPPENCPCREMKESKHWEIAEMEVETLGGTFISSCAPLLDSSGDLEQVIHLLTDISDLKETESRLSRSVLQLQTVKSLAMHIALNLSVDKVIQAALQELSKIQPVEMAVVYLLEEDRLVFKGALPLIDNQPVSGTSVREIGECLCGLAAKGEPIYSNNIHGDERCILNDCKQAGMTSFAALPLKNGNEVIGVLGLGAEQEGTFSQQRDFLEAISLELSIGLINATLYDKVERHSLELEKTVEEKTENLRRALSVMVGRENRMADLKRVVKQLRKQLVNAGLEPVADDPIKEFTD